MTMHYDAGARAALRKLGFLEGIDPEDLPEFLARKRRAQIQNTLNMQAAGGLPVGGLMVTDNAIQE